ncbi:MAG: PAS domain-containing protein, partial [Nitrospiraceae bacterium]|nr:PAS domain-containing protein [Nitrospiraceae bacterium]
VSRPTIYAIVTLFVIATFLGAVSIVHWVFSRRGGPTDFFTTLLAALVIALALQPLKERLQHLVERGVLKRGYDANRLCAQITRHAARFVHMDRLLCTVSEDLSDTLGIQLIRVWLIDDQEPDTLVCEYSSDPEEQKDPTAEHGPLLEYLRAHPDPVALKEILHRRPNATRTMIAKHLAELDAFVCVPLQSSSGIVGIVILGEKTSGDIYTVSDHVVFATIAGPLGTAIESVRLYAKLEKVNLHFSRILSNMRGGVVAVDNEGRVTTCNAAATEMLGAIEIGQHLDGLDGTVADVLRRTIAGTISIGDFECVIVGPSGEDIPVAISYSSLRSRGNGSYGAMALIYDLTQLKRLERNVQRADRMSSIGTLAAGMAHEVKNPLVSIKTFTQLLLDRFDDPDFRQTFVDVVPHEVDRIDTTVRGLLDFARPKPVQFAPQSLDPIIVKVLTLVENQTRKANVTVDLDLPGDRIRVHGDEQQLHQLFLNLFLNAVEAMGETGGGILTVRAYQDRALLPGARMAPFMLSDCVRIVVSDTGCGIDREHVDQLFTPFFTTKEEGSGLGLAVVHGIVAEHGGEIDVDSVVGSGTSFTVTFPVMGAEVSFEGAPDAGEQAVKS